MTTPDVNFDEILRVLDSMQLTAKHQVATPVNWKNGEHVIIVPTVSDGEVEKKYPEGFKKIKPYLRTVNNQAKIIIWFCNKITRHDR